jgi:hypothetical protein
MQGGPAPRHGPRLSGLSPACRASRRTVSWAAHKALNAQDDRFDLIDQVTSVREARKIVQSRDTPESSPDVLPST